ncbi:MAG: DUF418 domain-containing protein [Rhizobiales bacterium]|nr:DUF418 domain-containing protein [Hyphomicrobiales bacterium]
MVALGRVLGEVEHERHRLPRSLGVIAHVVRQGWLPRAVSAVARVGRMALSNYMLQGVLASILFYGWGLGLAQTPNAFVALGAWLGIAIVLIVFSKFWLSRFKQGPFETLWKRLSEAPFKQRHPEPRHPEETA